jgi:hypothetical protein
MNPALHLLFNLFIIFIYTGAFKHGTYIYTGGGGGGGWGLTWLLVMPHPKSGPGSNWKANNERPYGVAANEL